MYRKFCANLSAATICAATCRPGLVAWVHTSGTSRTTNLSGSREVAFTEKRLKPHEIREIALLLAILFGQCVIATHPARAQSQTQKSTSNAAASDESAARSRKKHAKPYIGSPAQRMWRQGEGRDHGSSLWLLRRLMMPTKFWADLQ